MHLVKNKYFFAGGDVLNEEKLQKKSRWRKSPAKTFGVVIFIPIIVLMGLFYIDQLLIIRKRLVVL